jgi:hypothetical protein
LFVTEMLGCGAPSAVRKSSFSMNVVVPDDRTNACTLYRDFTTFHSTLTNPSIVYAQTLSYIHPLNQNLPTLQTPSLGSPLITQTAGGPEHVQACISLCLSPCSARKRILLVNLVARIYFALSISTCSSTEFLSLCFDGWESRV